MSDRIKQDPKVWDWRVYILKHGPKNPTYRHVLLTLSCYMNSSGGSCFPSYDTLETATCLTRPTLAKYLQQGRLDGWINVSKKGLQGKKWMRNEYSASIPDEVWKAVHEVNCLDTEGSKPHREGSKADTTKAVNEVNSTSSGITSTVNSSGSAARAREDPVQILRDAWHVRPSPYQQEKITAVVEDVERWRQLVDRFALEAKTQKRCIAWIINDYLNPKPQTDGSKAEEKDDPAQQFGHYYDVAMRALGD